MAMPQCSVHMAGREVTERCYADKDWTPEQEPTRGRFHRAAQTLQRFLCLQRKMTGVSTPEGTAEPKSRPSELRAEAAASTVSSNLAASSDWETDEGWEEADMALTEGMATTNTIPQGIPETEAMPTLTVCPRPTLEFFQKGARFLVVSAMLQRLTSCESVDTGLQTAIVSLTEEHPAPVVMSLLRCAPTCDGYGAKLLQELGARWPGGPLALYSLSSGLCQTDPHAQPQPMSNSSSIRHFLLLALADTQQLQLLHFCLLLGISLAALLGNGLIISAVACGHHLHTPMFFFLLNLALSDLGSICTTVPKAMHNSLWDTRNISYKGCAAELFFFLFFISTEYSLLTVMCYDRYVSICKPLHYETLLGSRACAHMAAAAWASAFLNALVHTANTFSLPLCHGNALGQFFCELPQILKLSCSKSHLRKLGPTAVSACLVVGCFVFIVFSYVQIFRAVLRIPSEQGRHKAFSTCLPHLAVLSLFVSTVMFAYLKPPSISSPSLDLALSVLYSVVPPALNPFIYSLRNQELKAAVWRHMTGCIQEH
ncbi:olfactory receptor 14I1-like [Zonotrichia albicollis]|uniref:olfactory receptor 14I1-like n=1 Tax=Zonotrichia albicollis TaxID=44394 RepID=UPI003D80E457